MSIFRRNRQLGNGVSRSRLIIGLLVFILFLVLGLVWQAGQSIRTNRATATSVLQDYARLVSDEYTRRAMGQIGYYGYYAYINLLRRQIIDGSDILLEPKARSVDDPEVRASQLASYRFLINPSLEGVQSSQTLDPESGMEKYLSQRASQILRQPTPESGFTIDHTTLGGRSHTFVFAATNEPDRVFGFEVDRSSLSSWLRQVFEGDALLPKSLAGGAITNDFIFLRFTDDNDQVLFQSRDEYDPYLLVFRSIDDEYDGVFKGHTVAAAIDLAVADSLVIGGLPRSRLPVLIVTVLLTAGLLIAAIRQLHREHALMKMRSDFVSEVSHEMRTPLTQIRMFTETLLFERFRTNDDRRRALEIINRETQRLIHLVENVLRFSGRNGVVRGLSVVHIKLAPFIERVVDEFRPLAESASNILQLDLDARAEAAIDADALRQILLNLLDNAVKYGPPGQHIKVCLLDRPGIVRVSVCDQGPGVPLADREKIWDGYFRLERERNSAIAGTGIGLAVVRELVAQHGGSAWVADSKNAGACFVVEFPKRSELR